MKKPIIYFYSLLILVSFTACDFNATKNAETDIPETMVNEELALNVPTKKQANNKIFKDFIYDVGPRFNSIKKSELDSATAFRDFIAEEHADRIINYTKVTVMVLDGDKKTDIKETGTEGEFNAAQLKMLKASDYATSLLILANYSERSFETGAIENSSWTPYLTIVPEKQASYAGGTEVLKKFLKDETEEVRTDVDPEKLQPAKLFFTVTKEGTITNVHLDRPSGYPDVDKKMIALIKESPEKWTPAENTKGEKVDQVLVVSFGLRGC